MLPFTAMRVQRLRRPAWRGMGTALGALCNGRAWGRWPGVCSPAPRSRGALSGSLPDLHQQGLLGSRLVEPRMGACAHTPSHLPRHADGMRRRGRQRLVAAGRRWRPRAQAPFAVSPTFPGRNRVDAAKHSSLRPCPARVGRRTGAPPSPWRGNLRRLNARLRTALGRYAQVPVMNSSAVARAGGPW